VLNKTLQLTVYYIQRSLVYVS